MPCEYGIAPAQVEQQASFRARQGDADRPGIDRLDPIKQSLLGGLVGNDFVAVHMSWGAANEWSANSAYLRMAKLEKHPVLAELLKRIAAQETKEIEAASKATGPRRRHPWR